MSITAVFVAVLLANLLSGAFVYALWRLRRDEGDLGAIGIGLVCCTFAGVAAFATLT